MTLAGSIFDGGIYGLRNLEDGKFYVGYSIDDYKLLWAGRIVARTSDGELVVIEQLDGTLGVVWAEHFRRGMQACHYELLGSSNWLGRDSAGIKLTSKSASEAAEMLITHRRPVDRSTDRPVAMAFRSCRFGWHHEGTSPTLTSIPAAVFLDNEVTIGRTVARLLEAAGRICTKGDCPS